MKKSILILGLAMVCCTLSIAEMRWWTDVAGHRFEGEFEKEIFGEILVKDKDGGKHFIPLEKLSPGDFDYLSNQEAPELEIRFYKEDYELPRTQWALPYDHTYMYTFFAEIKKTSRLPFKGGLVAELFVVAEEFKRPEEDGRYILMHYEASRFSFQSADGKSHQLTSAELPFHEYDPANWKQGKVYVGLIWAVSDTKGNLVAYKTDISGLPWLTDNIPVTMKELRTLYINNTGSIESRHFNEFFINIPPPHIPWFPISEG